MNLKSLVNTIRTGNVSLGTKLASVLEDDCVILEYTDNFVLLLKEGKLIKSTFKLTKNGEIKPLENTYVSISITELNKKLNRTMKKLVESVATEDFVSAESLLKKFCETYKYTSVLKLQAPDVFVEANRHSTKGFKLRKKAFKHLEEFKSKLFKMAVIDESLENDLSSLTSLVESDGIVLALGKKRIKKIITESLLGNEFMAEEITNKLYSIVSELREANEDLAKNPDFDLEAGRMPGESKDAVKAENLDSDEDTLPEVGEQEKEPADFSPFDPSEISEEDSRELHREILKSILTSMKDFVIRKSNDPEETSVPANLEDKIVADLDSLEDPALSDERLSEIEAHWQELLDFFLTDENENWEEPEEEEPLDMEIPGSNESENVGEVDTTSGLGQEPEMPENVPPVPPAPVEGRPAA